MHGQWLLGARANVRCTSGRCRRCNGRRELILQVIATLLVLHHLRLQATDERSLVLLRLFVRLQPPPVVGLLLLQAVAQLMVLAQQLRAGLDWSRTGHSRGPRQGVAVNAILGEGPGEGLPLPVDTLVAAGPAQGATGKAHRGGGV